MQSIWSTAALLIFFSGLAVAAEKQFQAGLDYEIINPAWGNPQEQTVVYEFFGYPCPGCYAFQPIMHELESNESLDFKVIRVPVVFHSSWEPYAKAYLALQAMGLTETTHQSIFNAVHQNKIRFGSVEQIAAWLHKAHSVDKTQFLSHASSFVVDSQLRKGKQMVQAMGVGSTPTVVIDGKYKPRIKQLGSREKIVAVISELISAQESTTPSAE